MQYRQDVRPDSGPAALDDACGGRCDRVRLGLNIGSTALAQCGALLVAFLPDCARLARVVKRALPRPGALFYRVGAWVVKGPARLLWADRSGPPANPEDRVNNPRP